MDIHEQLAVRMAKERIEDAVRAVEQLRAIRFARARRSTRVRLGRALAQLGHWMSGQPSPAPGRGTGSEPRAAQPCGGRGPQRAGLDKQIPITH